MSFSSYLFTEMVDPPMYTVINNSMGSGSVTYECEGHETRLSDCMSPMSSKIAPCYYALVKCFTTDKKSTTSGTSAGIVAGVVGSLLAVLLVVIIVIIILIVWLKRRAKNLKPAEDTAPTTSPQSPTYASPVAVTAGPGASDVTLSLGNLKYQPTHFQPAQTDETLEYIFDNPLYSTATKAALTEM